MPTMLAFTAIRIYRPDFTYAEYPFTEPMVLDEAEVRELVSRISAGHDEINVTGVNRLVARVDLKLTEYPDTRQMASIALEFFAGLKGLLKGPSLLIGGFFDFDRRPLERFPDPPVKQGQPTG